MDRPRPPFPTFVLVPLSPFLFIASICLVHGGWLAVDQWSFLRRAAHAQGTVTRLDRFSKGDYPIVTYSGPGGESAQFKSRIRVSRGVYKVGEAVGVLYDPAEPTRGEIDDAGGRYAVLMEPLFGVLLVGFCLVCLFGVYYLMRHRSAQAG